eukprot:763864-Hanusia_phi.AAC.3
MFHESQDQNKTQIELPASSPHITQTYSGQHSYSELLDACRLAVTRCTAVSMPSNSHSIPMGPSHVNHPEMQNLSGGIQQRSAWRDFHWNEHQAARGVHSDGEGAAERAESLQDVIRKRGRPKGSKDTKPRVRRIEKVGRKSGAGSSPEGSYADAGTVAGQLSTSQGALDKPFDKHDAGSLQVGAAVAENAYPSNGQMRHSISGVEIGAINMNTSWSQVHSFGPNPTMAPKIHYGFSSNVRLLCLTMLGTLTWYFQMDQMHVQNSAFVGHSPTVYPQNSLLEHSAQRIAPVRHEEPLCRPLRGDDHMLSASSLQMEASSPPLNNLIACEVGRNMLKSAGSTESIENWSPVLPEDVSLPIVAGMAPFDPIAEG